MKFDCYYASFKVISLGPKMSLETNKSKKGYLSRDQKLLPICSRFIERDKP